MRRIAGVIYMLYSLALMWFGTSIVVGALYSRWLSRIGTVLLSSSYCVYITPCSTGTSDSRGKFPSGQRPDPLYLPRSLRPTANPNPRHNKEDIGQAAPPEPQGYATVPRHAGRPSGGRKERENGRRQPPCAESRKATSQIS